LIIFSVQLFLYTAAKRAVNSVLLKKLRDVRFLVGAFLERKLFDRLCSMAVAVKKRIPTDEHQALS
jgi:hypothetical protein